MPAIPIAFSFLLLTVAAAAAPNGFSLRTDTTTVTFDSQTGALTAFTDNETGRQWLAPDGGNRLYAVTLLPPDGAPLVLTLGQATEPKVRKTFEGVQISADSHGPVALGVRVEFAADLQTGLLTGGLTLRIPPGHILQSVRFPVLSLPVRIGEEGQDDRLLLPHCDGLEIHHPEANLRGRRILQYPGSASMQFLAAYDPQGGFFAATLDSEGHLKQFGFARVGETIEPWIAHLPTVEARSQWTLPYPTVLGTIPGDWQAAAEVYRTWAEKQPWCRTPLWKRKDIPAWAFRPSFYYTVSLRGERPAGGQGERLSEVAQQVADYQRALGAPVVAMLMSWERHGAWITPDYFPPVGGDAPFQALTKALHDGGNRSLVFLSGLKWTLRKTRGGLNYNDEVNFQAKGEKWAIVGEDGKVQRFGTPDGDVGEYAQICPATPFAHQCLSEVIRRCQELGIDCVQIDQIVGGGMPPCYSKAHGHPPGGGNTMAQAVFRLFSALRQEGKKRNPDFLLLMEEPGEFFIPVLDAYHARDYAEGRWPRDGAGVRGVPLFTYVYHHYCLGYGGDSAPLTGGSGRFAPYQHALNLIHGKVPAGATWSRWQPVEQVHLHQLEVLRNSLALLTVPEGELLLKGRRLATKPLSDSTLVLSVGPPGEERPYPALLHATYALPDGRLGRVLLNMGWERVPVEVPIPAAGLPGRRTSLTLYRAEAGKVTRETTEVMAPTVYPLLLEPLAPVLLVSLPSK